MPVHNEATHGWRLPDFGINAPEPIQNRIRNAFARYWNVYRQQSNARLDSVMSVTHHSSSTEPLDFRMTLEIRGPHTTSAAVINLVRILQADLSGGARASFAIPSRDPQKFSIKIRGCFTNNGSNFDNAWFCGTLDYVRQAIQSRLFDASLRFMRATRSDVTLFVAMADTGSERQIDGAVRSELSRYGKVHLTRSLVASEAAYVVWMYQATCENNDSLDIWGRPDQDLVWSHDPGDSALLSLQTLLSVTIPPDVNDYSYDVGAHWTYASVRATMQANSSNFVQVQCPPPTFMVAEVLAQHLTLEEHELLVFAIDSVRNINSNAYASLRRKVLPDAADAV